MLTILTACVTYHTYSDFRNDKAVLLAAINAHNGWDAMCLGYGSIKMRCDREVVMAAVAQDGYSLRYASLDFRADKEIVLLALKTCKHNYSVDVSPLKFASQPLKNDQEVVLAAVEKNGYAIFHASKERQRDRSLVLAALKQQPWIGLTWTNLPQNLLRI